MVSVWGGCSIDVVDLVVAGPANGCESTGGSAAMSSGRAFATNAGAGVAATSGSAAGCAATSFGGEGSALGLSMASAAGTVARMATGMGAGSGIGSRTKVTESSEAFEAGEAVGEGEGEGEPRYALVRAAFAALTIASAIVILPSFQQSIDGMFERKIEMSCECDKKEINRNGAAEGRATSFVVGRLSSATCIIWI